MKLLFDHNLSHKLAGRLDDAFPDSEHVRNVGLQEASDHAVWEYARSKGFTIVSKDEDFHQLSFLRGPPLKVVWVKSWETALPTMWNVCCGNAGRICWSSTTRQMERLRL